MNQGTLTVAQQLASYVERARYDELTEEGRLQLKIRVLDSLGCAIGALQGEPIRLINAQIGEFSSGGRCALIGGGSASPDRAAFYNSALVRYLDFNDSYLAEGETCHPSDNLGAVLAACEYAGKSSRDFLTALAVAYQVQCRLSDVAPVRAKGFDHTVQGCYALAAGISKALGLDVERTTHAIAISGTAFNALRVTRTGGLSHWKGLAYPNAAFCCAHACFLAMRGVTGPKEVFEGNKGFMESIAGRFKLEWSREELDRVRRTIIKKFNAEIHSQSVIEGLLELRAEQDFSPADLQRMEIEIFDVAYHIIGGGEEGDKTSIHTKEEADHSLPYMAAVAVLDGQVMPEQYEPERIRRQDVQDLLRKVIVRPARAFSARFPEEMPCRLKLSLTDGRELVKEKRDYEGFYTNPMRWETVREKFDRLSAPYADAALRREIADAVYDLEAAALEDLMRLLARVRADSNLRHDNHDRHDKKEDSHVDQPERR